MDLCCFEWATSCALCFSGGGWVFGSVKALWEGTYVAAAAIEQEN